MQERKELNMYYNKIHDDVITVLKYGNILMSTHTISITDIDVNTVLSILNKYNSETQIVQLIDERICYSEKQLKLAGVLTIKSFNEKRNISSKPQIEYMLYLAATTQIKEAIEKVGVKDKEKVCLVILTTTNGYNNTLLDVIKKETSIIVNERNPVPDLTLIREIYNIGENISEKLLESIILTKIAVLDTYK